MVGFRDQHHLVFSEHSPIISQGSQTDTMPQSKPDEGREKGSLVDVLPFLDNYTSERLKKEGRTYTSTDLPGESSSRGWIAQGSLCVRLWGIRTTYMGRPSSARTSSLESSPLRELQLPFLPPPYSCFRFWADIRKREVSGKGDQEEEGGLWEFKNQ